MTDRIGAVPGTVIKEGSVKNGDSLVSVMKGATPGEVELRTNGLVVGFSGGADFPQGHPICWLAQKLASGVATKGGVIVNGGENKGTMLAAMEVAEDIILGVVCPYHQVVPYGTKALVNSYQTRKMLISVMPVVVVFPGQVGTLDELITTIGWIKSLIKQKATPPILWVHSFWWDVLQLLKEKQAIQLEVWDQINKFDDVDNILQSL